MLKSTILVSVVLTCIAYQTKAQTNWMTTFETADIGGNDTFWNGSNGASFQHHDLTYKVEFDNQWNSWSGFSLSSKKDILTPGLENEFSAFAGNGANFSEQYAVVYNEGLIQMKSPTTINGCYITNSTYVALSLKNGDAFSKKFGGATGNDKDYFKLTATGYGASGMNQTEMYLADFQSDNNSDDYILSNWRYFDLSGLGAVDSIRFTLSSSDTGKWGMSTPAYFCLDNFNAPKPLSSGEFWKFDVCDFNNSNLSQDTFDNGSNGSGGFGINNYFFENSYNQSWNSWSGFALSSMFDTINPSYTNEFSAMSLIDSGNTYVVGYQRASILMPFAETDFAINAHADIILKVSNSTYAYKTMENGNQFAKKFGGRDGTDEDYLVLKIASIAFDGKPIDTVSHYLADFRSDNSADDFIQSDWQDVYVTNLFRGGSPVRFDFWIEGSDTGKFGLNTPAYFCLDDVFEFRQGSGVEPSPKTKISLYPNPAVSEINLKSETPISNYQIHNLEGKLVLEGTFKPSIDVSTLSTGVYFIKIQSADGFSNVKFIKK